MTSLRAFIRNILLNTVHLHANIFQLKLDGVGGVCVCVCRGGGGGGGGVSEGSSDKKLIIYT